MPLPTYKVPTSPNNRVPNCEGVKLIDLENWGLDFQTISFNPLILKQYGTAVSRLLATSTGTQPPPLFVVLQKHFSFA